MRSAAPNAETVKLLGVQLSRLGFSGALEMCFGRAAQGRGGYICFANAHSLTEAKSRKDVEDALNGATLAVADGVPLLWASRLKGQTIESRVCGPDFMKALMESRKNDVHGFIGGTPGQGEAIASKFGLKSVCYSPPMRPFKKEDAIEDWNRFLEKCPEGRAPTWVWIGLGAPKQELWMRAVSAQAPQTFFFGVGAAYDFLTGAKNRAPKWMQKYGLEWLYRFIQEPGRLWKRYLVGNARFVIFSTFEILFERRTEQL